jgi:hypothetical protein
MTQLGKSMENHGKAWDTNKNHKNVRACAQFSKSMVKFNDHLSKAFMINTGLKQRDALQHCGGGSG